MSASETIFASVLLFATLAATKPMTTQPAPRIATDAVTPQPRELHRHEQFLYRIKQGDIGVLFLGASIIDHWPREGEFSWMKFAPYHPANFGISGDRTENVLWRITHGELDGISPKVIVINIGTNNIGNEPVDTPEWTAAGIAKIVRTIHEKLPNTKVLLTGIFPRDAKDSRTRRDAAKVNELLRPLDDGHLMRVIDLGHIFLDANGDIPLDVMADRVHPTAKGYDLWYDAMQPVLDEMMK